MEERSFNIQPEEQSVLLKFLGAKKYAEVAAIHTLIRTKETLIETEFNQLLAYIGNQAHDEVVHLIDLVVGIVKRSPVPVTPPTVEATPLEVVAQASTEAVDAPVVS